MEGKSKCPKCGGEKFEVKIENVEPKEQLHFVRCSNLKCLIVIGILDRVLPTRNLSVLEGKLNDIKATVDSILNTLSKR